MVLMKYGNKNKKAVIRRSKSIQILKELMASWQDMIGTVADCAPEHHAHYHKWRGDVKEAVQLIHKFDVKIKGKRSHKGFPNFEYNHCVVDDIVEYKKVIVDLLDKLDFAQRRRDETRQSTKRPT